MYQFNKSWKSLCVACLFLTGSNVFALGCPKTDSLGVQLYIQELHALEATDGSSGSFNSRDEVYIRSTGITPTGSIDVKFPQTNIGSDYYEFHNGTIANASIPISWTNQNGDEYPHYPELWNGHLERNEEAVFVAQILEQDNNTSGSVKKAIEKVFDTCETAAKNFSSDDAKLAQSVCKSGKVVAGLIPDNNAHDLIGAVLINVKNDDGKLFVSYLPADADSFIGKNLPGTKRLNASDSPFVGKLESAYPNGAAHFETKNASGGRGFYRFAIVAKSSCPADVEVGVHKFNVDDIERGTCRGGKPVKVLLKSGEHYPIAEGESFYSTFLNRDIEYWCDGDHELEEDLFDRDYAKYTIYRSNKFVRFYPYSLEPYVGGISTVTMGLTDITATAVDGGELSFDRVYTWGPNASSLPDLRVQSINVSCSQNQPVIDVLVSNSGNGSAAAWVDLFSGLQFAPQVGDLSDKFKRTSIIPAGGSETIKFPLDASFNKVGYWFDAIVDTTRDIAESNESNNQAEKYLAVSGCSG